MGLLAAVERTLPSVGAQRRRRKSFNQELVIGVRALQRVRRHNKRGLAMRNKKYGS